MKKGNQALFLSSTSLSLFHPKLPPPDPFERRLVSSLPLFSVSSLPLFSVSSLPLFSFFFSRRCSLLLLLLNAHRRKKNLNSHTQPLFSPKRKKAKKNGRRCRRGPGPRARPHDEHPPSRRGRRQRPRRLVHAGERLPLSMFFFPGEKTSESGREEGRRKNSKTLKKN